MGEAAAVLQNYEKRTGDVLAHKDLTEKGLLNKLIPEDYDLKKKVSLYLYHMVDHFRWILTSLPTIFPKINLTNNFLQVTSS